MEMLSLSVELI